MLCDTIPDVMEPTDELVEQLDREDFDEARRMTFAQKFWAGAELFEYACTISRSGIRRQHPEMTEEQVVEELRRRVNIGEGRE